VKGKRSTHMTAGALADESFEFGSFWSGPLNPFAMQTMVLVLFGTVAGLQLEARFQLPEAPPTQLVVPVAGQAVAAV